MTTHRINFVGRIENRWLRRLTIIVVTPVLLALNCMLVIPGVAYWWWANNVELINSVKLRWNVRKTD